MKRLIAMLLLAALALCLCSCGKEEPLPSDLLEAVLQKGYMTVATEGDWAPWTYHDEKGELVGYDVELAKLVAEKLGVEVRFEEAGWDSILAGVDAGRFDIAFNGVGFTPERAEKYDFSDPYAFIRTVLVVRGDETGVTCFEDLDGKTTANTASSTYAAVAESYGATNLPVDSIIETIELLLSGRIDATVNADVSIQDYLNSHPEANIRMVDTLEDLSKVALPVKKSADSRAFLDAVNAAMQELRASGELARLSVKYFGADFTN